MCLGSARLWPKPRFRAVDVYAGALADGSAAVLFFNRGSASVASSTINLSDLPGWGAGVQGATVRDVFKKADLNKATGREAEFWNGAAARPGVPPSHKRLNRRALTSPVQRLNNASPSHGRILELSCFEVVVFGTLRMITRSASYSN